VGTDEVSHKERSHAAQASSNQHALRDHLRHRPGQHNAQDQKADRDGHNTLLYNQNAFCGAAFDPNTGDPTNVSVFITPYAGGTVLAGTIEYDTFCF